MKKILVISAATALLGMMSCSKEEMPVPGGDGNINFTVTIPGNMGTRAFESGLVANDLQMAVYDADTGDLVVVPAEQKFSDTPEGSLTTNVSINLASGRSYKIAFFAQNKASNGYTFSTDTKTITVNYANMATNYNTEVFDCFYTLYETGEVTGALSDNIELTRPVAQVNWGTSDLEDPVVTDKNAYGANASNLVTKVSTKAYTTFDMLTSDVTGEATDVTFPYLARPDASADYPLEPTKYKYVSMQYLLVPAKSSVLDITLEASNSASAAKAMATVTVANAPVQANYRTNIYGALLTNPYDFTVTKNKEWGGNNNWPVVPTEIKTNEELADALQNGGNFIIPEDTEVSLPTISETVKIDKPTKLQVEGKMTLPVLHDGSTNERNLKVVTVNSNLSLTGGGTIEADGGDMMFNVNYNNGQLDIDGVNLKYTCTSNSNRAVINTGKKPTTVKNSTITANCIAVRHNSSGKLTMDNCILNVNRKDASDRGMWEALFSRGNINLTGVTINSQVRGLEITASMDTPFEAMLKDCDFYAESERVLYVESAWAAGSKLTIDGGKYSCKKTEWTYDRYGNTESPIWFNNNKSGKKFDCNIISGDFVTQPAGFLSGKWPDWTIDDVSDYLAPGSEWEAIDVTTPHVYKWRAVKK